ncbi:gamma-butyrobetaine dioxygenase [Kushneria sinocarnis]|uniref:Gamma-butyrobetaine dioxygenase n=1 Tax=Kushneria sinocarnis TaxID=595502 RepID=A0A420X007_9GAMM|nr:TauD/TfdA family dioxygenase [Kushneria sinocarnis]RKR06840.1 gamma-butyrobetaine dioxygenase [Kushneria sinocarnis]
MSSTLARGRTEMKELADYSEGPALTSATLENPDGRSRITLAWEDGTQTWLPPIWLRDHCPCDACRHTTSRERLYKVIDDRVGVPEVALANNELVLHWPDGHESRFDGVWLYQRRPGQHGFQPAIPEARAWREGFLPDHVEHRDFTESVAGKRSWLEALIRDGLVMLDNGPTELDEVIRIAESIGPLRATNFGARFDVQSKPNPNNAAYTAIELELHTDLPNWRHPPDIQLLYCLENDARGGASTFADGFAVAEAMRREAPHHFAMLAETPIDLRFQDGDHDIAVREPIIRVDDHGVLREIRFNNWIRDALDLAPEQIEAWYDAYRDFWARLREPRYRADFELAPGQMIAFDNRRVLHGRGQFDPNTGKRHLQGCYLDYDMVESKLRVLGRHG